MLPALIFSPVVEGDEVLIKKKKGFLSAERVAKWGKEWKIV